MAGPPTPGNRRHDHGPRGHAPGRRWPRGHAPGRHGPRGHAPGRHGGRGRAPVGRPVAAVALLLAVAVGLPPPATAAPPPLPPPPTAASGAHSERTPPADLVALLRGLQRAPQARPHGTIGLAAIDDAGTVLAARHARRALLPASTTKLVTAAAALRLLGPDHRFVTRVYATTAPDDAGVVDGDLIVLGGGDPVLSTPTYTRKVNAARPATSLATLAGRIARSGVTTVTGRVLGNPSVLAGRPLATGWPADYLQSLDATRTSGLTVDAGLRLFRRSGVLRAAAASDPARRTAVELDRLLKRRDVVISGAPGTTRRWRCPGAVPRRGGCVPAEAAEVARIASPRLLTLLTHMAHYSDNQIADGVFRMLGAATGDPTWAGGAAAARAALDGPGMRWRRVRLADGSGLSRRDRLTADALVRLLRFMANGPDRRVWFDLFAVAGRSGTMAGRLRGTQAAGRVLAKTGTLHDVRALAATVPGRGGRDHHLVVLANDLRSYRDGAAARRLADVLALALVAHEDGCHGPIPAADPTGRRPPEHLICGAPPAGDGQKDSRR